MDKLKLPWINANQELPKTTQAAWSALEKSNSPPYLFRFGDTLCKLERHNNGEPVARLLTPDRLRHVTARAARWFEYSTVGQKTVRRPSKPPVDVIRDMLVTPSPPLPILERVVQAPAFGFDGALQTEAGYSPSSRTFLSPPKGLTIDKVPTNPTRDDIAQARKLLTQLLVDFPFVSDGDAACAVELALLPFARSLIAGPTPLHLVESPSPGTGKGLLVDVCLSAAYGQHIGVITQVTSEPEWRKQITALLMQGKGAIIIDNVTAPLKSRSLAVALTALDWQDRILGQSKMVRLPVRSIWVATGNNPTVNAEISRRSIRCRLDSDCRQPWKKSNFKHPNLREWADQHRADLVRSALVLVQAWITAGQPLWQSKTLGSYEQWAMTMGGILETAGVSGFLDNLDDFYQAADTESGSWELLVDRWWNKFHQRSVGARELFQLALDCDIEITGNTDRALRTSFGVKLRRCRDKVIGKFKIVRAGQANRAVQWSLKPIHLKKVETGDGGHDRGGDGDDRGRLERRGASLNPDHFSKEVETGVSINPFNFEKTGI